MLAFSVVGFARIPVLKRTSGLLAKSTTFGFHYPSSPYLEEAVSFCDGRFIKVIASFVVPVLTGTCGFVAAAIPPKGGTTNTICKKSQPQRIVFQERNIFKTRGASL